MTSVDLPSSKSIQQSQGSPRRRKDKQSPRPRPRPHPRPRATDGKPLASDKCRIGQIDKSTKFSLFTSKANSYEKCLQECRGNDGCKAFDYTTDQTNTRACRGVKELGEPRIGDGGSHKRQFCVMDVVGAKTSSKPRTSPRPSPRPKPSSKPIQQSQGSPRRRKDKQSPRPRPRPHPRPRATDGNPLASDKCRIGQIDKSTKFSPFISKANSYEKCLQECRGNDGCKAFDYTTDQTNTQACRGVKELGEPRIGDGGSHKRQFCVMDVVGAKE